MEREKISLPSDMNGIIISSLELRKLKSLMEMSWRFIYQEFGRRPVYIL